jgi:hypothetical protein
MTRSAILFIVVVCLVISSAGVEEKYQPASKPSAIPRLNIIDDSTATALKISALDIKTVVAGNIATTCFDIRFYNPNDKILEGEFEFPLADGQDITRYALDMNGSLREAVVVEKAKARVAFENTVRRKIDPGLVEKTKGNNFRTRVYPIPAKGYRRILIEAEQTLEQKSNKDLLYQLPLYEDEPIDTFAIKITVIKSSAEPEVAENGTILNFKKQKDNYVAEHHQTHFKADQTIEFLLQGFGEDNDVVLTENHNAQTYFYVNSRIAPQYKEKKKPATIGVFWDVSSSGERRDRQKEMELLKKYLSGLNNVSVSLIPFNIYTQTKEDFTISGGNTDKLFNRLESLGYDGGTQFGAIDLTKYNFEEVLLFSDGLSTFGKQEMIFSKSPVITITTSPSANYSYLKYIAQQTHGKFIDLGRLELDESIKELNGQSLQILNIIYDHAAIEDVFTQTTPILNTGLSFAGKLKNGPSDIKVELGFGNEVVVTKQFTISKKEESDYDQVKRIWATMKISRLDMEYEKNKEDITKLGKEFSVVTQNTSLLVLDRVEDYVQYEIVPPAELQNEYYSLLKEKQATEKDQKENTLSEAIAAMDELKEWWNKKYSVVKRTAKNLPQPVEIMADGLTLGSGRTDSLTFNVSAGVGAYSYSPGSADSTGRVRGLVGNRSFFTAPKDDDKAQLFEVIALNGYVGSNLTFKANPLQTGESLQEGKAIIEEESVIELNEWKSDAVYLKTLEQTPAKERKGKYLSLKNQYGNQPSFFVDVARFFFEKNEKQLALVVLSNVAEMKLEDAELMRIIAHQLMDMEESGFSVMAFGEILKMREEDPQSYRDLALAYNETGEYNKAIELLYKLVTGEWDERFGDVKAIALNEMNAIISSHPAKANTQGIDKRLIYAMPVDVRIVISWNTDNSDIDLWVTDPRNEKCSYENTETGIGGKISQDVTQGYGPEEFCLKKAWKGNYKVDVNLFGDQRQTLGGPIAIKADLFTDFGKPTQKRKTINLRVTTSKEIVNLGSLKFGS